MEIEILKMILAENSILLTKIMDNVDGVGLDEIGDIQKQIAKNSAGDIILDAM